MAASETIPNSFLLRHHILGQSYQKALPKMIEKTYNLMSEHRMHLLYYQHQYKQGEIWTDIPCAQQE